MNKISTPTDRSTKSILIAVFITIFLDLLGGGLAIPVMPALITDADTTILPSHYSPELRKIIFGFLTGVYFLAQFIGAPILGAISDRDGRKKVLWISVGGTMVGYLLFAGGIYLRSIEILFFARIFAGFMAGNLSVALSIISDVSTSETKTRNFGLVGAAFGLGFIFGPALGGMLSNASISPYFTLLTPFIVAAALAACNIVLVTLNVPETLAARFERKVTIFTGIENLKTAFREPNTRTLFSIAFLITFGFSLFTQFFSIFCAEAYHSSPEEIGIVFSYVGVWAVIAQGFILRPLSKVFSPTQILSVSLLLLSGLLIVIVLPSEAWYMFWVIPFMASAQGMTQPNMNTLITNTAPPEKQGQILGVNQSVQSIAMAIPPMVAGFLSNMNVRLPNYAAACFMFMGWALLYFVWRRK